MRFTPACICVAAIVSGCQAAPGDGRADIPEIAAAGCPAPGSRVEMMRATNGARASTVTYLQPDRPGEEGLCVIRVGPDRRRAVNLLGRGITPEQKGEHARLQRSMAGLRVGARASSFVIGTEGIGRRSVQLEVTYRVLRDEAVTVPAGTFDTVVLEEQERNGSCVAIWTSWVDKATRLPVKFHGEALNCLNPQQIDLVAGRVRPA